MLTFCDGWRIAATRLRAFRLAHITIHRRPSPLRNRRRAAATRLLNTCMRQQNRVTRRTGWPETAKLVRHSMV